MPGKKAKPVPFAPEPGSAPRLDQLTRPLRILSVTARYLPSIGGTEIHTAEVSRRLAAWGNDVTVLTTDPTGRCVGSEKVDGVNVVRVRAWPRERDWYASPAIYSYITGGRWDVVHCQGYHTFVAPAAMAAAVRSHQKFVVTFHSGGHSSVLRRAGRPLQQIALRPLLRRAECLIGVSDTEATFFANRLRIPRERFRTFPNGVSLPTEGIKAEPTGRCVVVSVGRLERYKGHHRAIEALPLLVERVPNILLRVVGTGPYESTLRNLARRLGVTDLVEFLAVSPSNRDLLAATLKQADLVVLLSSYESHGMAAQEAIALERPLLVSDTSALREYALEGNARTVPVQCPPDQLATTIHAALLDPLIPVGSAVPTWDTVAEALLALYQSVVSR